MKCRTVDELNAAAANFARRVAREMDGIANLLGAGELSREVSAHFRHIVLETARAARGVRDDSDPDKRNMVIASVLAAADLVREDEDPALSLDDADATIVPAFEDLESVFPEVVEVLCDKDPDFSLCRAAILATVNPARGRGSKGQGMWTAILALLAILPIARVSLSTIKSEFGAFTQQTSRKRKQLVGSKPTIADRVRASRSTHARSTKRRFH